MQHLECARTRPPASQSGRNEKDSNPEKALVTPTAVENGTFIASPVSKPAMTPVRNSALKPLKDPIRAVRLLLEHTQHPPPPVYEEAPQDGSQR